MLSRQGNGSEEASVNILSKSLSDQAIRELRNRVYGVVVGIVTNNKHDQGKYMVKVRFPWLQNGDESGSAAEESDWCRITSFMAGGGRGAFFLPEVGDEVLVAFEHGDIGRPFIIGSLWNGSDSSIHDNKGGKNTSRSFKSRSGHMLTFFDDDPKGGTKHSILLKSQGGAYILIDDDKKKVLVYDQSGKNTVTIDSNANKISVVGEDKLDINAKGDYTIKCNNLKIPCAAAMPEDCKNYKATASSNATIKDSGQGDVEHSGT